ncbi:MAG: hypothetical protein WKG01_39390 [Kofleriaceae bacterium]
MRIAGILIAGLLASAGCKDKSNAAASPDPAALKAQQELLSKRDELMAQQKKLEGQRDKLDEEIAAVSATGGDVSELAKKKAAIETALQGQSTDLTSLTSKLDQVVAQGGASANIATREATMASREKTVAGREKELGDRERQLAQREAGLAQREKETCGAAAPMIIQQVAAPKGDKYTRKEIEPLLGRARANMQKKGLLAGDLPAQVQGLEGEATRAMGDGDWGKAYLAAAQLSATVDAIKVDRGFISAKYARLQSRVKSAKVDESVRKQLTEGMGDVLQKYGDGDFAAANKKLNQLFSAVR